MVRAFGQDAPPAKLSFFSPPLAAAPQPAPGQTPANPAAASGEKKKRPSPAEMFKGLDSDKDGKLSKPSAPLKIHLKNRFVYR